MEYCTFCTLVGSLKESSCTMHFFRLNKVITVFCPICGMAWFLRMVRICCGISHPIDQSTGLAWQGLTPASTIQAGVTGGAMAGTMVSEGHR